MNLIRMNLIEFEFDRHSEHAGTYSHLEMKLRKFCVELALKETNGNKLKAAKILGVNRNTFTRYIKDLNITYKRDNMRTVRTPKVQPAKMAWEKEL